jgi:hypothetical protein
MKSLRTRATPAPRPTIAEIAASVSRDDVIAAEKAIEAAQAGLDAAIRDFNNALRATAQNQDIDQATAGRMLVRQSEQARDAAQAKCTEAIAARDAARQAYRKRMKAALADRRADAFAALRDAADRLFAAWDEIDAIDTAIGHISHPPARQVKSLISTPLSLLLRTAPDVQHRPKTAA